MRAKILLPCLMILGLSVMLVLVHRDKLPMAASAGNEMHAEGVAPTATVALSHRKLQPSAAIETTAVTVAADPAAREEELSTLGMSGEAAALPGIVSSLTDPDAQVRAAARSAAIQFGSRDAIPWLQAAMSQAGDVYEKAALQSAIDYLQLPTLAEATVHR